MYLNLTTALGNMVICRVVLKSCALCYFFSRSNYKLQITFVFALIHVCTTWAQCSLNISNFASLQVKSVYRSCNCFLTWVLLWFQEMYLHHMIHSMLKQLQLGETDQTLLSFIDKAMRVEERKKLLESQYSQELSLLYILQEDYDRAKYYTNCAMQLFMEVCSYTSFLSVEQQWSFIHLFIYLAFVPNRVTLVWIRCWLKVGWPPCSQCRPWLKSRISCCSLKERVRRVFLNPWKCLCVMLYIKTFL